MDKDVEESIRLDAWRSVFERADRILSELPVTVTMVNAQGPMENVAGWSDGLEISLNTKKVKAMLRTNDNLAAVLRLKGLNYHELSHVLFTPRMNDEMPKQVIRRATEAGDRRWWYAYNALEDQRIETWFTAMYGISRRYFEATILEWIIREGNTEAAILVYGRKYLAPKIRVQAGIAFQAKYGKALYEEFQTVIDEYITLVLPTDTMKAIGLVEDYYKLLLRMREMHVASLPQPPVEDHGEHDNGIPGTGTEGVPRKGRIFVSIAKEARDKAQDAVDDAIDADTEEERQIDLPFPVADGQSQDAASSSPGATGDPDFEEAVARAVRDLMDAAGDNLDQVKADEQVQEDAENILDSVRAVENNGRLEAEGKVIVRELSTPTEHDKLAVRRVTDILTRIRQEAEPETLRRQHHGRLEPRRYVTRQPHEIDVFKTWDHGAEEETGVEAVILADFSGSMKTRQDDAAGAIWALKRSFDKVDIRTTVLVYNTGHKVLYQPSERAEAGVPVIQASGGTNPLSAMQQAHRILSKSSAPNKVLINLTDGAWYGAGNDENVAEKARGRILKQLHALDVTTMLLGLNGAVSSYGRRGHQTGHDIESVSELPKAALKLVASIMRAKALRG